MSDIKMSSLKENHAWHIQNLMDAEPEAQVVELHVAEGMQARIRELEKTILETLDENGHLADDDVCTLIKLKRVMGL